ncbi:MAG: hypothetical protein MJ068_03115 [Clostridia bacterium]|nr:hypothetical protein [Clostridia bacterium]
MVIVIKEKKRVIVAVSVRDCKKFFDEEDYCDEENVPLKVSGKKIFVMMPGNISDVYLNLDDTINYEEPTDEETMIGFHVEVLKECYKSLNNLDDDNPCNGIRLYSTLTVIENGRVFDINPSLRFKEVTDFVVHGNSDDCEVARATLEKTKSEPAKRRIREVMNALRFSENKFFPIVVMDNKKFTPEIWRE